MAVNAPSFLDCSGKNPSMPPHSPLIYVSKILVSISLYISHSVAVFSALYDICVLHAFSISSMLEVACKCNTRTINAFNLRSSLSFQSTYSLLYIDGAILSVTLIKQRNRLAALIALHLLALPSVLDELRDQQERLRLHQATSQKGWYDDTMKPR